MIGLVVAVLAVVFWSLVHLDVGRRWPQEMTLPSSVDRSTRVGRPRVVAVVPARDEEEMVRRSIPALLEQRSVDIDVLLVDDNSKDQTAAAALGAADPEQRGRLSVLRCPPTPLGWSGKVHALAFGVDAIPRRALGAAGEPWLLLLDADIELAPDVVRSLIDRAESDEQDGPFDLVSVMARLNSDTFWERVLIPPFVFFFQLLFPFRRVRSSASRVAAAAGGCVLLRPGVLRASGGLQSIRGALIDDVALGRLVKSAGYRTWLGIDHRVRSLRRYSRLEEIWRMVSRTAFVQLRFNLGLLLLTLVALAVFVVSPPLMIGSLWLETSTATAIVAVAGGIAWGLEALALWPVVRHHRVDPVFSLTLPFAACLYAMMCVTSAWDHWSGRGSRWKERTYTKEG